MELGKLKKINIRKVWEHEQYDFSQWLASDDNIKELGDLLGLTLSDIETEKFVGNYRCDILCKDEITGKVVLLENQLEPTNHDHLGKIITYASGLDASVIVWIVQTARDEHASAIEWLNKHTNDNISFFLIEIQAYQIGDSLPAAMFKIIEQPNDFVKKIQAINKDNSPNKTQANRLEFWTLFNEFLEKKGKLFSQRKATTDHWYSVSIGSSQCHLSVDLINKENRIRISMWIPNNKNIYDNFYFHKNEIENSLGYELYWERLDNKNAARICTYIENFSFDNKANYKDLMDKTVLKLIEFKKVFKPYLKKEFNIK